MQKKLSQSKMDTNHKLEVSYSQNAKQLRLNGEILRVRSIEHLRLIVATWSLNEEELCDFFSRYESVCSIVSGRQIFDLEQVKLVRTENKIYLGQIRNKRKHGVGISIYKEGRIYEGGYYKNQKEGKGCEIYSNGNMYVGDYVQNKKHGKGTFFWFSLCDNSATKLGKSKIEQYEGDWWGGLPDGMGQHEKVNGDFYVGQFKNGLKHGQGIEYYGNADSYKGQFINGLPEGYGQYVWSDGSIYKGDFKQGYRNGYGVWSSAGGNENYKGHYVLDKKHGYGIYDWGNGYHYKGSFFEDLRSGEGQLFLHQKIVYAGFWMNGEKCEENQYKLSEDNDKKEKVLKNSSVFFNESKSGSRQRGSISKGKAKEQSFLVNFKHGQGKRKCTRNCEACRCKNESREKVHKRSMQRRKSSEKKN